MSVKTIRPVRPGLAAVALLGACFAGGTVAAGEAPKVPARDAGKDLFTVFSAAGAAKAPALTGDPGVATDARPGLFTWEGYPDQMETFIRAGGAKSIFAISPHTYWFKGQPEDRDELNGGYAREIELMRKNGLSWPVWIGEMGCTTFLGDSQHFKSVTELDQLRLAQTLLKQDDSETDPAGNARAAFFALAAGQEGVARPHLERCGPHAERVLAGFDNAAPAAGSVNPSAAGAR